MDADGHQNTLVEDDSISIERGAGSVLEAEDSGHSPSIRGQTIEALTRAVESLGCLGSSDEARILELSRQLEVERERSAALQTQVTLLQDEMRMKEAENDERIAQYLRDLREKIVHRNEEDQEALRKSKEEFAQSQSKVKQYYDSVQSELQQVNDTYRMALRDAIKAKARSDRKLAISLKREEELERRLRHMDKAHQKLASKLRKLERKYVPHEENSAQVRARDEQRTLVPLNAAVSELHRALSGVHRAMYVVETAKGTSLRPAATSALDVGYSLNPHTMPSRRQPGVWGEYQSTSAAVPPSGASWADLGATPPPSGLHVSEHTSRSEHEHTTMSANGGPHPLTRQARSGVDGSDPAGATTGRDDGQQMHRNSRERVSPSGRSDRTGSSTPRHGENFPATHERTTNPCITCRVCGASSASRTRPNLPDFPQRLAMDAAAASSYEQNVFADPAARNASRAAPGGIAWNISPSHSI